MHIPSSRVSLSCDKVSANLGELTQLQNAKGYYYLLQQMLVSDANMSFLSLQFLLLFFILEHEISLMMATLRLSGHPLVPGLSELY